MSDESKQKLAQFVSEVTLLPPSNKPKVMPASVVEKSASRTSVTARSPEPVRRGSISLSSNRLVNLSG